MPSHSLYYVLTMLRQNSKLLWSYIIADWCMSSAVSFNSTFLSSPLWLDQSSVSTHPSLTLWNQQQRLAVTKWNRVLTVFFLSLMSENLSSLWWNIHFHIGNYFHLAPKQDLFLDFLLTVLSSFVLCFELARNCSKYVMYKSKPAIPLLHTLKYIFIFYCY